MQNVTDVGEGRGSLGATRTRLGSEKGEEGGLELTSENDRNLYACIDKFVRSTATRNV